MILYPFIKSLKPINTYNKNKEINGWVLSITNVNEYGTSHIEQVYMTYCNPGDIKGPHMHYGTKEDRFYCIKGKVVVVCRNEYDQQYQEFLLSEFDDQLLVIPPYNSHAIISLNKEPSIILSIPNEGYKEGSPYNQIETFYDNYNWNKWRT